MYKWLKEYFTAFGKDFPFSKVADLNEYEIIRIIQYCVKTNTEYSDETEPEVKAAGIGYGKNRRVYSLEYNRKDDFNGLYEKKHGLQVKF